MPGFAAKYGSDTIVDVRVSIDNIGGWTTSAEAVRTDEHISTIIQANL